MKVDAFVAQLRDWGYDPDVMAQDNWSSDGFYEVVVNSAGLPVRDWDGDVVLTFQKWRSPEHYEFVADNFVRWR